MVGVDECGERRLGCVVPFAGRCLTARVLRSSDDFEVGALELVIQFLPTWQIKPAPSPGGPGDEQDLLAAELREAKEPASSIRHRDLRRHP